MIAVTAAVAAASWIEGTISLRAFTVQVNLLIAACYGWLALRPPAARRPARYTGPLRGGVLVAALALSAIFFAEGGDGGTPRSLLAHLVTTLLVLADWLLTGRDEPAPPRWLPVAWLAYPVAYLVMTLIVGTLMTGPAWRRYQYPFLNPTVPGFLGRIAVFAALILLLGVAVLALARLRTRLSSRPRL